MQYGYHRSVCSNEYGIYSYKAKQIRAFGYFDASSMNIFRHHCLYSCWTCIWILYLSSSFCSRYPFPCVTYKFAVGSICIFAAFYLPVVSGIIINKAIADSYNNGGKQIFCMVFGYLVFLSRHQR
jgi:hypothetical protein